jgi:hypothetical protein
MRRTTITIQTAVEEIPAGSIPLLFDVEYTVSTSGLIYRFWSNGDCYYWGQLKDEIDRCWEEEIKLPTKKEVCWSCNGEGTTTSHVECDGGGFTSSEWAEACYDDPDFADHYMSGVYDRPCNECEGLRVIDVVDEDSLEPHILKEYHTALEEDHQAWVTDEAERRAGC